MGATKRWGNKQVRFRVEGGQLPGTTLSRKLMFLFVYFKYNYIVATQILFINYVCQTDIIIIIFYAI